MGYHKAFECVRREMRNECEGCPPSKKKKEMSNDCFKKKLKSFNIGRVVHTCTVSVNTVMQSTEVTTEQVHMGGATMFPLSWIRENEEKLNPHFGSYA